MKERIYLIIVMLVIVFAAFAYGAPTGGEMTEGASSRRDDTPGTAVDAAAGNVTQLDINQIKITSIWQGFYGNITGTITLDNANNQTFYDWAVAAPQGEVYASRAAVSDWSGINCTNGTQIDNEQTTLNIQNAWTDSINRTFTSNAHTTFYVGSREMRNCWSTQAYNATEDGVFWNVLLSSSPTNVVYTALIADNTNGFNNKTYDFEILVPTNYNTGTASYYFYVELQ